VDADAALENEVVILDENLEAQGHDFLSVGVLAVSPDDTWLALAVDVEGHERHRIELSLAHGRPRSR
jgi:oligopeptidase B